PSRDDKEHSLQKVHISKTVRETVLILVKAAVLQEKESSCSPQAICVWIYQMSYIPFFLFSHKKGVYSLQLYTPRFMCFFVDFKLVNLRRSKIAHFPSLFCGVNVFTLGTRQHAARTACSLSGPPYTPLLSALLRGGQATSGTSTRIQRARCPNLLPRTR